MDIRTTFYITRDEYHSFHKKDRALFTILVIDLFRDPTESIQIMAMFLWLERKGYTNMVVSILSLPHFLINEIADDVVTCLNYINRNPSSPCSPTNNIDIPLLKDFTKHEISLQILCQNRVTILEGISKIIKSVCLRAFLDITTKAIERSIHNGKNSSLIHSSQAQQSVDYRTLFVTFSKGYPVQEWEVQEFFTRIFGDCIESLYMQEVPPKIQSLFARIIFRSASTIDGILGSIGKAKFTINGKHVWARRFVPKRIKQIQSCTILDAC